jgi:tetrahydrodipicolinate N-succinyltransferase
MDDALMLAGSSVGVMVGRITSSVGVKIVVGIAVETTVGIDAGLAVGASVPPAHAERMMENTRIRICFLMDVPD